MARFTLPSLVLGTLGVLVLAVPAGAAPADRTAGGALGVSVKKCVSAGSAGRAATFEATMRAIPGGGRMEIRFDLVSRPDWMGGVAGWKPVRRVSVMGRWLTSDLPKPGSYSRSVEVAPLRLGSAYRAVVRFRWRSPSGRVLRRATRVTSPCVQEDLRPDLRFVEARAFPGLIQAVIRNAGISAPAFDVKLVSGGRRIAGRRFPGLAVGKDLPVVFAEPRCERGSTVRLVLDAGGELAERSEDNNSRAVRCPASG